MGTSVNGKGSIQGRVIEEMRRRIIAGQAQPGENLSELDVGRAEGLQSACQPHAGWRRIVPCAAATEEAARQPRPRGQQRFILFGKQSIVSRQHPRRMPQTSNIREAAKHQIFHAECKAATPPVRLRTLTCARPAFSIIFANAACGGKRRILSAR